VSARGRLARWGAASLAACGLSAVPLARSDTGSAHRPAPARGAGARRAPVLDVRPDWTGPGRPVPAGLVGLSVEWPLLAHDLGDTGTPPPALVDALRLLGRPALRIGGNSQDRTWPTARGAPVGATFAPPRGFWAALGRLDREAGGAVEVGLDLAHGDAAAARVVARAAARALPAVRLSFSLGNEPDRYGVQRWATLADRRVITARPRGWSFPAYLRQYAAVRRRLGAIGPLVGPDFADARWRRDYAAFLAAARPRAATIHAYPLNVCGKRRRSRRWPTARALLARSSWAGEVRRGVAWAAADAARMRIPLIVSEANSVACRGAAGVSDGAAAALWAPAFLLSAARAGVARVDLHASGAPYDPFRVLRGAGGATEVQPSALFDGLLFTREVLGGAPRLLGVRTTPRGRPAWALRGADGRVRVLVENLDSRRPAVARIRLPQAIGWASVVRMTPAGHLGHGPERMAVGGRTAVAVGGRLVLAGRRTAERAAIAGGRVSVVLAPRSAALVVSADRVDAPLGATPPPAAVRQPASPRATPKHAERRRPRRPTPGGTRKPPTTLPSRPTSRHWR
jgi:hypothetical protein